MAMGLGNGFDKEDFAAPMAEINTTPLVDVMLVLLVIFLVTAPMLTQAIKLELPNETASQIADENPITLSIDAQGAYFWNEESLSADEVEQRLQIEGAAAKKRPIHLRADKNAAYGSISKVLALAQKYELNNVGFVTEPE